MSERLFSVRVTHVVKPRINFLVTNVVGKSPADAERFAADITAEIVLMPQFYRFAVETDQPITDQEQ